MFFDTYGDEHNPTLVLLHGAAALDTFSHQYEPLSRWFRVLVPHLPGAGEAVSERYDPQATADAACHVDRLSRRRQGVAHGAFRRRRNLRSSSFRSTNPSSAARCF